MLITLGSERVDVRSQQQLETPPPTSLAMMCGHLGTAFYAGIIFTTWHCNLQVSNIFLARIVDKSQQPNCVHVQYAILT